MTLYELVPVDDPDSQTIWAQRGDDYLGMLVPVGEPVYRIDQRFIPSMMHTDAEGAVHIDGVLVPVEPDYEAMATVMNVAGWTCDGHEPGAWCEDCKRLQLSTARKMWRAGIGGDDEG